MQVVLPVLSAAGLSCAMLPTALLSSHTGGFGQVHRRDLSGDMQAILAHWRRLALRFDAVYVGYLGAAAQAQLVLSSLDQLMASGGRLYVDPVMGDHGQAYSFCGEELVAGFAALCRRADVIFPNRTEAALLLGQSLQPGKEPDIPDAQAILSLGAPQAVLSGVDSDGDQLGLMLFEAEKAPQTLLRRRYPGAYPGTGDLLASAVIGGLTQGLGLEAAAQAALDFIGSALEAAQAFGGPARYGLPFEVALPGLINALAAQQPEKQKGI